VVWGGLENCSHTWNDRRWYTGQSAGAGSGEAFSEAGPANAKRLKAARWRQDSICTKCGAWKGSLGMEPLHDCLAWARGEPPCSVCYVCHLRIICHELWRVLRDDGICWLVLGDSYYGGNKGNSGPLRPGDKQGTNIGSWSTRRQDSGTLSPTRQGLAEGLKTKDLCGIPWRVAMALQADGWWLRSDIIFSKLNPMPESCLDRCTRSHEYVFMLSKNERYYYDSSAIAEPAVRAGDSPGGNKKVDASRNDSGRDMTVPVGQTRNRRDVWTIATQSFKGAHFATFPEKLVEPMILSGSSTKGCCPKCGAGWTRITRSVRLDSSLRAVYAKKGSKYLGVDRNSGQRRLAESTTAGRRTTGKHDSPFQGPVTLGWRPTCPCYDDRYRAEFPKARSTRKRSQRDAWGDWWKRVRRRPGKDDWSVVPAMILDPFLGSGTTCLVAQRLGRRSIGIELSLSYCSMAKNRIENDTRAVKSGVAYPSKELTDRQYSLLFPPLNGTSGTELLDSPGHETGNSDRE
jgi:DNA modification methylase